MSRVVLREDLDSIVAEQVVRPRMDDILDMLLRSAQQNAPDVKIWVTMRDDRVRLSHERTDGQAIPANLRFKVPKVNTGDDINDVRFGHDLARYPRDPSLPIGNRINCRCSAQQAPHMLRQSLHRTQVTVTGTRVEGSVYTDFPRAAESEFGTTEDAPSRFMAKALQEVAIRLQSGISQ